MIKGLRTAVYKVTDLEEAKRWYTRVLGIEPYFDEPFYVGYNVGGYELGLDPDMTGVTYGSNVGIYWGVDNMSDTLVRLTTEANATIHSEPQDVGGGIIVASLLDPFGNVFGLIENPHFKIDGAEE
jgi:lactoylglutathione lyase